MLIVFLWGVWHGMMQTYGFCRIYDAKTGSFEALTRRLDFATCGIWFATAIVLSPARMTDALDGFYASGVPFISPTIIRFLQQGLLAAAIAVSIIAVADLSYVALKIRSETYRILEVLTAMAVLYCIMGYPQAKLADWVHRKLKVTE